MVLWRLKYKNNINTTNLSICKASSIVSGNSIFLVSGNKSDRRPAAVPTDPKIMRGRATPNLESINTPYKYPYVYNNCFHRDMAILMLMKHLQKKPTTP